jgi:hypothetical protein
MKNFASVILSLFLAVVLLVAFAYYGENGDVNAASMYLVVFLGPIILLVGVNGLYLRFLKLVRHKLSRCLLSLLPVIILSILSFKNDILVRGIDGNMVLVMRIGAIALFISNVLWAILELRIKEVVYENNPKRA